MEIQTWVPDFYPALHSGHHESAVGRIRFALKWCAAWLSSLRDFVVLHITIHKQLGAVGGAIHFAQNPFHRS
jgi:hypothetical protein